MKVLLTTHQFFPEHTAGTEVLTLSVASELIARGHEVRVLSGFPAQVPLFDHERRDEYVYAGIRVYRFHHSYVDMGGQRSRIEIGYDNRLAADYFEDILADFAPDVVHFFHLNRLGTGLILRAVKRGVPAFLTPTDFWSICPTAQLVYCDGSLCSGPDVDADNCVRHFAANTLGQNGCARVARIPRSLTRLIGRLVRLRPFGQLPYLNEVRALGERLSNNVARLNQLRRIVAPNAMIENLLLRYGVRPERVVRAGYGIRYAYGGGRRERPVSLLPLRVGFIGTLAEHKGCHVLLEAFRALPEGSARLKIYGSETDSPDYAQRLRRLAGGVLTIEFCGVFPNTEIDAVLDGLDVLVVPSIWSENTPLVIYSAQAAGCPVVASDVPGIATALRDGVDGLLFKGGDSTALAECLQSLTLTPSLLAELSANARPPKSIITHVDELLEIWADRA